MTPSPKNSEIPQTSPTENTDITTFTREQLRQLKQEIQTGKFNFEIVKEFLDNLPEGENKPFILGAIFSGLNKLGISIKLIQKNGKIQAQLKGGKQSGRGKLNVAPHGDVIGYEELINSRINTGKISTSDINKALLYRTGTIDNYIDEVGVENASLDGYVERLLKKYNIYVIEGKVSDIISTPSSFEEFKNNYQKIKDALNHLVTDSQAEKEFLISFFDYIYYTGKLPLEQNEIKKYKKVSDTVENNILNELESLTTEEKYALGIRSYDNAEEAAYKLKNDPLGFFLGTFSKGGGALGLLLGIIGAIFWGKKGFFGGFIAGMGLIGGGPALLAAIKDKDENNPNPQQQRQGNQGSGSGSGNNISSTSSGEIGTETNSETGLNGIASEYYSYIIGLDNSLLQGLDKNKLDGISLELFKNEKFLDSPTTILSIFSSGKTFDEIKEELNRIGINLNDENKKYYEFIFSKILEKKSSDGIGGTVEGESVRQYLERRSNENKDQGEHTELTNEKLEVNINKKFEEFKQKIKSIDESYFKSEEQKENEARELATIYQELYSYMLALELRENINEEQKNKINTIKLYLAKYYGDKGEVDNDHNRNYLKSVGLALQLLPDEGKPEFPSEIHLAERLKGQTGITDYISQELINGRSLDEVLTDRKIKEGIVEIQGELIEEYETSLENYLSGIGKNKLNAIQKEALDLLVDIQGIGWFNAKESNLDIVGSFGGTLLSIGAGIGTFAGISSATGVGIVPGIFAAVGAGIVTTAGIMITNGDNYFVDWDTGLKELAFNTATIGAGGLVFKGARAIRGGRGLLSLRGGVALGFEMVGDIHIGAFNDMVRGYFQEIDIPYTEALANNLIWGLLPLGFAGAGQLKRSFSGQRLKLAEDIVKQAKGADFLHLIGNKNGARKIRERIFDKIFRARAYDPETQNLLKPLERNLDDIRLMNEGEIKVFNDYEVTLRNGTYTFKDTLGPQRFQEFLNNNKGKNGVDYTFAYKGEKLTLDIDSAGNITKVVRENGKIITDPNRISTMMNGYFANYSLTIQRTIIEDSIKGNIIKSTALQEAKAKLKKVGDEIEIGSVKIKKVTRGYQVNGNAIYPSLDDIINDISIITPNDFITYGVKTVDVNLRARIADINFKLKGEEYFFDQTTKTFKVKKGNARFDVADSTKFIEENFEFLFKHVNGFSFTEGFAKFENSVKNITLKKFIDKVGGWGEIKPNGGLLNSTMSEIFALPKVVKQLSELKGSGFKKGGIDLMKILFLGDKNRTLLSGVKRAATIGGFAFFDHFWGDSNDNEWTDALCYMYGGIITTAIGTALFDDA